MSKQKKKKTYRDGITDLLLVQAFFISYGYIAYEMLKRILS